MTALLDDIRKRGAEDPKTAVVTFDDGWIDHYVYALPILERLGVPATFFSTTAHVHQPVANPKKMSVPQLRELLRAGMTIGGHSRSHPNLTLLPPDQARAEIGGAKEDLEAALGVDIRFFAYPGGAFNRSIARIAREAGYAAACSVLGPAQNDGSSVFWLYRDHLGETMDSWHDRYRLSPTARRLFSFRVHHKLRRRLEDKPQTGSADES